MDEMKLSAIYVKAGTGSIAICVSTYYLTKVFHSLYLGAHINMLVTIKSPFLPQSPSWLSAMSRPRLHNVTSCDSGKGTANTYAGFD